MTDLKVMVAALRDTARDMGELASGYYNDGAGPALATAGAPVSGLDVGAACREVGDAFLAHAQTLGDGVSELGGKLDAAGTLYERGDGDAAERIDFDTPEPEEQKEGDDPGEDGYDPVDEYEERLREEGLLTGPMTEKYREWLQNAADNGVPPEVIAEIAREHHITPQSFDVLNGLERMTDDNGTPDPSDDKDYFLLPPDATPEQARQATLMTYIYNAGTGYADGNPDNNFAETPYSADEVQRIIERQSKNAWSYDKIPEFTDRGGRFVTTPNGMMMGLGGDWIQETLSQQGGSTYGDMFALNIDNPSDPVAQLRGVVESGKTWQDDAGGEATQRRLDLDRLLHHEERHSQQWAERGFERMIEEYAVGLGYDQIPGNENPFEVNAGHEDGGYH